MPILGSAYGEHVGAEIGRLIVALSPWIVVSVGVTIAFPLAFVIEQNTRTAPRRRAGALLAQLPLAWAGAEHRRSVRARIFTGALGGRRSRPGSCASSASSGVRSREDSRSRPVRSSGLAVAAYAPPRAGAPSRRVRPLSGWGSTSRSSRSCGRAGSPLRGSYLRRSAAPRVTPFCASASPSRAGRGRRPRGRPSC